MEPLERQLINDEWSYDPKVPEEPQVTEESTGDVPRALIERSTILGAYGRKKAQEQYIPTAIETKVAGSMGISLDKMSDEDGNTDPEIESRLHDRITKLKNEVIPKDTYSKLAKQGIPEHILYKAFKDKPETEYDLMYSIEKYKDLETMDRMIAKDAGTADYLTMFLASFGDVDSIATGGVGTVFKAAHTAETAVKMAYKTKTITDANGVERVVSLFDKEGKLIPDKEVSKYVGGMPLGTSKMSAVYEKGQQVFKKSPIVTSSLSGVAYASLNQAIVNYAGDITDVDSVKDSALWGLGLGSTAGFIAKMSNKYSPSNRFVTDTEGNKVTHGEYLQGEISKLDGQLTLINKRDELQEKLMFQKDAQTVKEYDAINEQLNTINTDLEAFNSSNTIFAKEQQAILEDINKAEQEIENIPNVEEAIAKKAELDSLKSDLKEYTNAHKKMVNEQKKTLVELQKAETNLVKAKADVELENDKVTYRAIEAQEKELQTAVDSLVKEQKQLVKTQQAREAALKEEEARLDLLNSKLELDLLNKEHKEVQASLVSFGKTQAELNKKLTALEKEKKAYIEKREFLESELDALQKEKHQISEQFKNLKDVQKKAYKRNLAHGEKTKSQQEVKIQRLEAERNAIADEQRRLVTELNSIGDVTDEIASVKNTIQENTKIKTKAHYNIQQLKSKIKALTLKTKGVRKRKEEPTHTSVATLKEEIASLKTQLVENGRRHKSIVPQLRSISKVKDSLYKKHSTKIKSKIKRLKSFHISEAEGKLRELRQKLSSNFKTYMDARGVREGLTSSIEAIDGTIPKVGVTRAPKAEPLQAKVANLKQELANNAMMGHGAHKNASELRLKKAKLEERLSTLPNLKGKDLDELRDVSFDFDLERKINNLNKKIESIGIDGVKKEIAENKTNLKDGKVPEESKIYLDRKQKLQEELDDYLSNPLNAEKLKEVPMFSHIATALEKWSPALSPVTRLYKSDNSTVRAIVSLLSPPIVALDTFVNNLNAKTFIRDMRLKVNGTLMDINKDYEAYIKETGETLTVAEYFSKVERERLEQIGKQERTMAEEIANIEGNAEDIAETFRQARNELNIEYKHNNKHIESSMRKMEEYYSSMGDTGRKLKITNLTDTAKYGYNTQIYSENVALSMRKEGFVKYLVDEQVRYAKDHHLDENIESFTAKAETAYETAISENQRYERMFKEFDPKQTYSTVPSNKRSILIYADAMSKLQDKNTILNMLTYSRAMGGKFALKKFLGIEKKADIGPVLRKAGVDNSKDIKNLSILIDTIAGFREVPRYEDDWEKLLHGASTISSMLHTMGFGIAATTEITSTIANTGFINTMSSLMPSWKGTMRAYKGTLTDNDILEMSILREVGTHKFGGAVNRLETEGDLGIQSKLQEFGDDIVHKEAYLSGLTFMTDWFKTNSSLAGHKFILEKALEDPSKITTADRRRLNQNGISDEHLATLRNSMYTDGKFTGYSRSRLDKELLDTLDRAQNNIAYNSILHPDGFNLPKILTEGSSKLTRTLNNSLFKFLRFPIASYEALLLNGVATADAKQAIAAALNAGMWSQILLAKDKLNNPDDLRYDLDSKEGKTKLVQDTLMSLSFTGGLSSVGDLATQLITGHTITGYKQNLGGVTISDTQKFYKAIETGGEKHPDINIFGIKLIKTLEHFDTLNTKGNING